jgi:hypothetical protein
VPTTLGCLAEANAAKHSVLGMTVKFIASVPRSYILLEVGGAVGLVTGSAAPKFWMGQSPATLWRTPDTTREVPGFLRTILSILRHTGVHEA